MKLKSMVSTIGILVLTGILFLSCSLNPDDDPGGGGGITAPSKPAAASESSTTIRISWTPVTGAAEYKVYRCSTPSGEYYVVDTTRESSYTDSALMPGSTYYYRIAAVDSSGMEGPRSDYASAKTQSGISAPVGLTVTDVTKTSITLQWTGVSGAAKYKIYTAVTSTGIYDYVAETNNRTYLVHDLVAARTYFYKVSSVDADGKEGPLSTYVAGATLDANGRPVTPDDPDPEPVDETIPAPTSVTLTALSANSIKIAWNTVSGASEYNVYRASSSSGDYGKLAASPVTGTTHTDTELAANTIYYYKVNAIKDGKEGNQSTARSTKTQQEPPVPVPSGLTVTAQDAYTILVSWNLVSGAEYNLYRSATSGGTYQKLTEFPLEVGTDSYRDEELTPSTTYYYQVSAVMDGKESAKSSSKNAKTPVDPDKVYRIGDTGPAGGLVFYDKGDYSDGWRYLEAASRDAGNAQWGTDGFPVARTETGTGNGKANTDLIIRALQLTGESGKAAQIAQQYEQGEYSDWFLPSKDELNLMYTNLELRGMGGFSLGWYWSSSEANSGDAWRQRFSDGSQGYSDYSYHYKTRTYVVRAIRAF